MTQEQLAEDMRQKLAAAPPPAPRGGEGKRDSSLRAYGTAYNTAYNERCPQIDATILT